MEVLLPLVKYCKAEHNPYNGCKSLQLGTAQYYREMDPSFSIADSQEGMISMHDSENHITFENSLGPNCYIFCISTKELSDEIIKEQFHVEYNSKYYLNYPDFIAEGLSYALQDQLRLNDFTEESQHLLKHGFKIKIKHYFGLVRYGSSVLYRDLSSYSALPFVIPEDVYVKSHFTKRDKYSPDAELRIIFIAFAYKDNDRRTLSPRKEPKLLHFPDGLDYMDIFSPKKEKLWSIDDNTITYNDIHEEREILE